MERVSGAHNWRLVCRRTQRGVTILQAQTCEREAALPETVWGLPVVALGDHALCSDRTAADEEAVEVTCGLPDLAAEWDNRQLQSLALPKTLERVGDYALLNCGALKTLRLYDNIHFWGSGALMNCRKLDTFHLTCAGSGLGDSLAFFADELSRELDVTIVRPDGIARLLFPEFRESYEENSPAHHFDYNIFGAGYPYHHCFHRRQLRLRDYDGLWPEYLRMEYDPDCALRLAYYRLRNPLELSETARSGYLAYLQQHGGETLTWLLGQRDGAGLGLFLRQAAPDHDTLSAGCDLARRMGWAEAVALLLEELHRRFPTGVDRSFDL